ncbi:hypothetical protein [[Acidovorax] ebreus]|uniref:hypothetical protein n=1 Tax=Diaphorobacter sp. LI3 TaxID=2952886 RepID=UPI00206949B7|nr:hypothetical protein MRB47_14885 [Diaphorobacter sp. LI3]
MALRVFPIAASDGAFGFGFWFAISEVHFRIENGFLKDASEVDLGKFDWCVSYRRAADWAWLSL